ncbi:TIGR03086 family metal-binding protein [Ornithinimicrobium sp. F0845]|uniref:TIGR03086 family metal-binding protein n=1 Tax=Ornithinimicrobium sp. F0845 TaxID=2926412 RepID=UPI001FF5EDB0|nr:TIGR03086 family metal-binding protein [Ornithinimicrobium sp. F0845]
MSRAIELIPEASRVVTDLPLEGEWSRPTPCEGWNVRDLLNHLTSEHLWAPHLLRGETLEQVGSRYDGDVLGKDPVGAWRRAISASVLAWGQADPDGTVHTSVGRTPLVEYASQMLVDLTVHAWDLARAVGVRPHLVADAVEECLAYEKPRVGAGEVPGIFAAPVPTESESRVDQLVALLGRDPAWAPT